MELYRDNTHQNKILKQYKPSQVYAKWIPCTEVVDDMVYDGDWDNPIYGSGRWGIYEKAPLSGQEVFLYVVETTTHKYRDITDYDVAKLYRMNKYIKAKEAGFMNPDNYSEAAEVNEFNNILKEKEKKRFSDENKEKAKDMWGRITNRPYITAGIDL